MRRPPAAIERLARGEDVEAHGEAVAVDASMPAPLMPGRTERWTRAMRGSSTGYSRSTDQVDDDEHQRAEQHQALHDGDVLGADRGGRHPAEAVAREHRLDDDRSGQQLTDDQPGHRQRRQRGVAQRVAGLHARSAPAPLARAVSMYGSRWVVRRLLASTWAMNAPVGIANVIAGSTTLRQPSLPMAGNHDQLNENCCKSNSPSQNEGMATPSGGRPSSVLDSQLRRVPVAQPGRRARRR